jgi:hypothetical protein
MSEAAQKLLEQIRALPDADRDWLVTALEADDLTELQDDPAFQAMVSERPDFAAEHPDELLDGDEVLAEARRRLQDRRQ